ncbi:MAG: GDSL-type esterase/lipase family protein [Rikenellaceae bacterium]|jgi:lysophospholipase L1-like esterase|nr:GDSL-type esterase/lipase family protein [Rikenellaceae bacterium]
MKKYFLALLALAAALPGMAQQDQYKWAGFNRYAQSDAEIKARAVAPVAVFIGNSITEGWVRVRPAFFESNNYVGRGISGQTTPQFLSRFRADVIELRPRVAVIGGGINDMAEKVGTYNADLTFGNICSMAELARINGITPVLTSVLPAALIPWNKELVWNPSWIAEMNARIKAYAAARGIAYVDYYAKMEDGKQGLIAEYTYDGVHVTAAGYAVMEALVQAAIDKALDR